MKYYQNKTTGEIVGVENMRELIKHPTELSQSLGYKGYSYEVIYDMICPNKILGHGIVSYCVTYHYLKDNYKRINRNLALKKYPQFKQYRHSDMVIKAKERGIEGIEVLHEQTF